MRPPLAMASAIGRNITIQAKPSAVVLDLARSAVVVVDMQND